MARESAGNLFDPHWPAGKRISFYLLAAGVGVAGYLTVRRLIPADPAIFATESLQTAQVLTAATAAMLIYGLFRRVIARSQGFGLAMLGVGLGILIGMVYGILAPLAVWIESVVNPEILAPPLMDQLLLIPFTTLLGFAAAFVTTPVILLIGIPAVWILKWLAPPLPPDPLRRLRQKHQKLGGIDPRRIVGGKTS